KRKLEKDVFCYIDGARLDARSEDISAGGMFLKTEASDSIPHGSLIGLVFEFKSSTDNTTFLFGRVVRKQESPLKGAGLRWEKAVTVGTPEQLAQFLAKMLQIEDAEIRQEDAGKKGLKKSVYHFPGPEKVQPPKQVTTQFLRKPDAAAAAQGLKISETDLSRLNVQVVHTEQPKAGRYAPMNISGEEQYPKSNKPGFISSIIQRKDLMAATSVDAAIETGGASLPVKITRIGIKEMFVSTSLTLSDKKSPINIKFPGRIKEGKAVITCACRLISVESDAGGGPGLYLGIEKMDEGGNPGLYLRFIKWIHFKELSGE
ncbi:MAG: PilZ domain-containing protein, partial [Deltaproteobacteria bacterium]|nr:PilZ domain-containing protein [Deltaproteobacteria bacterium]